MRRKRMGARGALAVAVVLTGSLTIVSTAGVSIGWRRRTPLVSSR
jgi:hypothetical protein